MKKRSTITSILIMIFVLGLVPADYSRAADTNTKFKGKILLQVESHGEAWYVNPATGKRHYMADGNAAYNIMRELGVGITNKNLEKIKSNKNFAKQNSGKIFLQVELNGEAYYLDFKGVAHYLKDGAAAYSIMRDLGLGITNDDLNKILQNGETNTKNLKILNNAEIVKKLKDSVVYIETTEGSGSGFIIESNGYILTNAHVVKGVASANVILSNNKTLNASIVGRDENIDLAILKINEAGLKKVSLGDSNIVKQGDEIFTLGYPFGIKGDVSFKDGTVSRKLNDSTGQYFEISAEIHPGNSGGPLVDRYGQVVGINTAIFGQNIQGIQVGETIKLAIPINIAKNILTDLKNGRNIINTTPSENTNSAPKTNTCSGNVSDLQLISGTYSLYGLHSTAHDILPESNEMNIVGVVKNNNANCIATNINMKIVVNNKNDTSLNQEEIVLLKVKDSFYSENDPNLTIYPQKNGEYKVRINVYDTLINNNYSGYFIDSKTLKDGVEIFNPIISADWVPVN